MGKTRKAMLAFIDNIPNSKLEGGIASHTIHFDVKFRLDNQCTTTAKDDKPVCYNLQIQVNNRPKISSLADAASFLVAKVEMSVEDPWSASLIKKRLKESCIEHGDKTHQF